MPFGISMVVLKKIITVADEIIRAVDFYNLKKYQKIKIFTENILTNEKIML